MSLVDEVECRTEISYLRATGRLPKPPKNVGTRIETIQHILLMFQVDRACCQREQAEVEVEEEGGGGGRRRT